jgi:deaminated glutathione amidase
MIINPRSTNVDYIREHLSTTQSFFRIAAIQMASGPMVEGNLREAEKLIELAAASGAKLIALPEYFCLMGLRDRDKVIARETPGDGPIQRWLSDTARKHKIWLIGGSVPLATRDPEKVRNACLIYNNEGGLACRYDKMHLFGFETEKEQFEESRTIEPGDKVVTCETPYGKVGVSICYDLRFPELYRAMGNVDIIVVPSAFTETTGRAHWETLIRARAIENQCYVLAPAQGGYHVSGRETHGDTMIVDPWGVVLDRLPRGSGVVVAGVNPKFQRQIRQSLPALKHRTIKSVA